MWKSILKKGHLWVPFFILFSSVSVLRAEYTNCVVPPALSVLSSFKGDEIITEDLFRNTPFIKSFSKIGKGETAVLLLFSHTLMTVLMKKKLNFEKKAFLTFMLTGFTALTMKHLFHRTRPNTGKNVFYGPGFSWKNLSLPSGHTQLAFAMAGLMSERYGYSGIFYTLAGFVGVARIAKGMHYFSDVVLGGFTGYFLSKLVLRKKPCPKIYIYSLTKEIRILYLLR